MGRELEEEVSPSRWRRAVIVSFTALSVAVAAPVLAQESAAPAPLVDEIWAAKNANSPDVLLLDLRPQAAYDRGRLAGAVFANYPERWRPVGSNGRRGFLRREAFAELASELGIDNGTHVVLIHSGRTALDAAGATDIFLSFRLNGHRRVSILNAPLTAAADAGIAVERGPAEARARQTFDAVATTGFLAGGRKAVREAIGTTPLVDMRRDTQFLGLEKPEDVAAPGTIPTARNLPGRWVFDETTGRFRDIETLRQVFAFSRIPLDKKAIFYGNNSALGALGWFAARELLGNQEARVYAGGMGDWMLGTPDENPRIVRYLQTLDAAPVRRP